MWALTAVMTGAAYATSAEMAQELGPFPGFEANRDQLDVPDRIKPGQVLRIPAAQA